MPKKRIWSNLEVQDVNDEKDDLDDASNAIRKNDKSDEKIEWFNNEIIDDPKIIQNY